MIRFFPNWRLSLSLVLLCLSGHHLVNGLGNQQVNASLAEMAKMTSSRNQQGRILEGLTVKLNEILDVIKPNHGNNRLTASSASSGQPRDCLDIQKMGHNESGIYTVYVEYPITDLMFPNEVYCDLETDQGGWLVIQRRQDGKEDFYRGWDEYKYGFGDKTGEFWLGNELLHKLTRHRRQDVRFDLWVGERAYYVKYALFHVESADEFYKVHIASGSYRGTAADHFGTYHNNQYFSTKDMDKDAHSSSFATTRTSAWWYKNSYTCDLNRPYGSIQWNGLTGLTRVEMKIRPIDNNA